MNVTIVPPKGVSHMTPQQALDYAALMGLSQVIIIGKDKDGDSYIIVSEQTALSELAYATELMLHALEDLAS